MDMRHGKALIRPSGDRASAFSFSMKDVFVQCLPRIVVGRSVFTPYLTSDPTSALVQAAQIGEETLVKFQDVFAYHRHITLDLLKVPLPYTRTAVGSDISRYVASHNERRGPDASAKDDYMTAVNRICLIVSHLKPSLLFQSFPDHNCCRNWRSSYFGFRSCVMDRLLEWLDRTIHTPYYCSFTSIAPLVSCSLGMDSGGLIDEPHRLRHT